ncbi:hypothetical protein ACRRTK_023020 [Alexandromys fortis]
MVAQSSSERRPCDGFGQSGSGLRSPPPPVRPGDDPVCQGLRDATRPRQLESGVRPAVSAEIPGLQDALQ